MSWLHNLKTFVAFAVGSILLIFLSCDIFDSNKNELLPLEGRFLVCAIDAEFPDSTVVYRKIKISIITEKTYPCANYDIRTKVSKHGNKITIGLLYITVPEICLTMLGPANTELFFNLTEGKYSLNFYANEVTDKYELSVSDTTLKITEIESRFTKQGSNCAVAVF